MAIASSAAAMRPFGISFAVVALLAIGPGCSSDGGATGGHGGAGGGAGTVGSAGTTGGAGTTGSAGTTGGAGTTGRGGTTGAGGTGGGGGVMNTGAGGNPDGCPASKPQLLQSCNFDTTAYCNYPGATCACRLLGAVDAWVCLTCPDFEPPNASACTPPSAVGTFSCSYGTNSCACRTDGQWYCRCKGCP